MEIRLHEISKHTTFPRGLAVRYLKTLLSVARFLPLREPQAFPSCIPLDITRLLAVTSEETPHFLLRKRSAQIQIEENDVYDYLQNDAEIYGFEASFAQTGTYRGAAWSAEISYSDITGELDNGDPLRSIPTEKIGLFGKLDYDHLSMGLDVIFADDQSDVPSDQHPTDGYIEVSADLLWRPTFSPGTSVAFGIDNLLNQEIRHHTSELKDKVPEAGRNFKILITQSF